MAKAKLPAILSLFGLLSVTQIPVNGASLTRNILKENAADTFTYPGVGTTDPAAPLSSRWQGSAYGFSRTGDLSYAVTGASGWGYRCGFNNDKTFSSSEFEIELYMGDYARGDAINLIFGGWGSYVSEATALMSMDVLRYSFEERPHDYMITLNTAGAGGMEHNTSVEGWTNNTESPWLDSYAGVIVTSETDTVKIGFKVNGDNVDFYVNEVNLSIPKATIFANMTETFHLGFGTGYSGGERHFRINHAMDGADKEYYKEEGIYYAKKAEIASLVEELNNAPLADINEFINLYSKASKLNISALNSYDQLYLRKNYDAAMASLESRAKEKFGNAVFVESFGIYANDFHGYTADLSNEDNLLAALKLVDTIKVLKEKLDSMTLSDEEKTRYETLLAQYNEDYKKVNEACNTIYSDQVNGVIAKMNAASTTEEVASAEKTYNSIRTTFRNYMKAEDLEALEASLKTSRDAFMAKFQAASDKGEKSDAKTLVVHNEKSTGLIAYGHSGTGSQEAPGLLFTKEQYDVSDFSFTYTIKEFQNYAIALMDEPGFFGNDDGPEIQNHKGLVFLVRAKNETAAYVESYLLDGACNRFFDGQLSQTTFDIPKDGTITLSLKTVLKEASGIYDNYFEFDFNGSKYETPLVKAFSLLGAFDDRQGYLSIGSLGGEKTSPLVAEIENINGTTMDKESHVKEVNYTPEFGVESVSFENGSKQNVIVPLNPKLEVLTEVSVDGKKLDTSSYSYTRNSTLTLKASYLNTLEAGDHTLTVKTAKGQASVPLKVTKKGAEPEPGSSIPSSEVPDTPTPDKPGESKGLTTGAIVGIAIGCVLGVGLIGLGVWFFLKKKKK